MSDINDSTFNPTLTSQHHHFPGCLPSVSSTCNALSVIEMLPVSQRSAQMMLPHCLAEHPSGLSHHFLTTLDYMTICLAYNLPQIIISLLNYEGFFFHLISVKGNLVFSL